MNLETNGRDLLATSLILLFIFDAAVLLNIPIVRPAISLLFLTAIPGFLLVKTLRLDVLGKVQTVLFSVGFSLALIMLLGGSANSFANALTPFLGNLRPLSTVTLLIITNVETLLLAVAAYWRIPRSSQSTPKREEISIVTITIMVIPVVLAVSGAFLLNFSGSNLLFEVMILSIAVLFSIAVLYSRVFPPQVYPILVFVIAISLLLQTSLVSTHIVSFGSDINLEYFTFKTVENNAFWSLPSSFPVFLPYARVNAMLSVTILPVMYSTLSNLDSTLLFKLFFPFILSLVAVGLYQVWQMYVGKKYALISAFLFMAQATFYTEMLGLNRQIVAELFFALLLIVMLNRQLKPLSKTVCFIIFIFGLVVSHYSVAEIFLFFLAVPFVVSLALKHSSRKTLTSMVVLFSVLMFFWYIFTTNGSVFSSFEESGGYILNQIGDFFNPSSRGNDVLLGLGYGSVPSVWNMYSRLFAYATEALIVLGFIGSIIKRTKVHFETDYFLFCAAAMAFLVAIVVVPGLAKTFNMTRFYHILLFFLAPLCVLGVEVFVGLFAKHKQKLFFSIFLLAVILPYFFFQTGFIYELTGTPNWSISLNKNKMNPFQLYVGLGYVTDQDVAGAKWMQKSVNYNMGVWADDSSARNILEREALLFPGYIQILSKTTMLAPGEVLYLSTLNIVDNTAAGLYSNWNMSDQSNFDNLAVIYSNGANQVLKDTR